MALFGALAVLLAACWSSAGVHPPSQKILQAGESNIDPKESPLLKLHRQLVNIESTSGQEGEVGLYLLDHLHAHNLSVKVQEVAKDDGFGNVSPFKPPTHNIPKRFNIYAHTGSSMEAKILLTSHIDTVPPYYPYERHGDVLKGRGTVDDKACVAAQITAFLSFSQEIQNDMALLFVVDEEVSGVGMKSASHAFINDGLAFDAVVFGEPTEAKLVSGHKGNMGMEMYVKGKSSHSGYPWLGTSANSILIAAMAALEALQHGKGAKTLPWSKKYGNTTLNIGRIEGGSAGNVLAESAEAKLTFRLAAGTPEGVQKLVREAISNATEGLLGDDGSSYELVFPAGYSPVDLDCDIKGFDCITVNYGTDVPNLAGSHKRYLYGPGSILVAHSDHETLTTGELKDAVDDYKKIIEAIRHRASLRLGS